MKHWALFVVICCLVATVAPASSVDADSMPLERVTVPVSASRLTIWSRQSAHPKGVIVLVHGRTWSARPAFDLQSRTGSRSLLKALAAAGFATYAVDLRGYGATPRAADGWLTPTQSVEDVEAVLRYAADRHATLPAPILLGWSRGAKIAALTATRAKEPLSALVLYAFTFDPEAPPLYGPISGVAPLTANTAVAAKSDFISPEVTSPALIEDFVYAALRTDPIRVNVCCDAEFSAINPDSIHIPTLIIQGARDPGIKPDVAAAFFSHLSAQDRRWIVIARGDHAAHLEGIGMQVSTAIIEFINSLLSPPCR